MNSLLSYTIIEYDKDMKKKRRYNGLLIYASSSLVRDYTGNVVAGDGILVTIVEPTVGSIVQIGKSYYRVNRVNTFMKKGRIHHYESEVTYASLSRS
jgi:hypothetical protein